MSKEAGLYNKLTPRKPPLVKEREFRGKGLITNRGLPLDIDFATDTVQPGIPNNPRAPKVHNRWLHPVLCLQNTYLGAQTTLVYDHRRNEAGKEIMDLSLGIQFEDFIDSSTILKGLEKTLKESEHFKVLGASYGRYDDAYILRTNPTTQSADQRMVTEAIINHKDKAITIRNNNPKTGFLSVVEPIPLADMAPELQLQQFGDTAIAVGGQALKAVSDRLSNRKVLPPKPHLGISASEGSWASFLGKIFGQEEKTQRTNYTNL